MPALMELVDQSLLVVREGDRLRYRFLETVREYGLARLAEAGEVEDADARLRSWALTTARSRTLELYSPAQVEAMGEVRAEAGNLAAVMRRALERGDAAAALPLVGVMASFWTIEGDHLAVMEIATRSLELVSTAPDPEPEHVAELRGVLAAVVVTTTIFSGTPPAAALERLAALGLAGDGSRTDGLTRLLLEVYDGGAPSLEALDRLCEDSEPHVARAALQWATQAREDAGDLAGAVRAARTGLALCDDGDGPWTRALFHSQLAGLATQGGDWTQAVEHATRAIPVMRDLGAGEDVMQLRSVLAYADIAAGRLEEAARVIDEIAADERQGQTIGWSVAGVTGEAELALARGETETGLRLYLDCLAAATERRVTGFESPNLLMPWVLFAEASALFAHVLHGHRDEATWLARQSLAKLPQLLSDDAPRADYPVLGGVLLAVGSWVSSGSPEPPVADAARRMVALGHRFGYHRSLPTMAWAHVLTVVDPDGAAGLEVLAERYHGVPATALRAEARDAVSVVAGPGG
jgi:hypothetical protein